MKGLMCRLVCRINKHISIFIIKSHCTFRLQKRMLCPWGLKMMRNHISGIFYCLFCISPADMLVGTDIVFLFVKNFWCIRCCRFFYGMNAGQYFVFYFDQLFGFFCSLSVHSSNQNNSIPQIMNQTSNRNQCILIMFQMSDLVFSGNIFCCNHCLHTWQRSGFGGIYGQHSRSGILTSQSSAVKHPFQIKIIRIFSCSKNFFFHINS